MYTYRNIRKVKFHNNNYQLVYYNSVVSVLGCNLVSRQCYRTQWSTHVWMLLHHICKSNSAQHCKLAQQSSSQLYTRNILVFLLVASQLATRNILTPALFQVVPMPERPNRNRPTLTMAPERKLSLNLLSTLPLRPTSPCSGGAGP